MKKIVENWLNKQLKHRGKTSILGRSSNFKKYLFLRWVASLVEDKAAVKDVLSTIAIHMYEKKQELPFLDIFLVGQTVYIVTTRPGLWIGRMGSTIDEIIHKINHKVNGEQIHSFKVDFIEDLKSPKYEVITTIHCMQNNW